MAMNRGHGWFGFGQQSARDSVAAAPTVAVYASDSSDGISSKLNWDDVKLTMGGRSNLAEHSVSGVDAEFKLTTLAFADLVGVVLAAALGSDDVDGESSPYTHTVTAGEDIPYLTVRQQVGSATAALQELRNAKVDKVKLTAEGTRPLVVEVEAKGTKASWLSATSWSGADPADASDGWYTSSGCTVLLSLNDDTPAAISSDIVLEKLEVEIENDVESKSSLGKAEPGEVKEGTCKVSYTLTGSCTSTAVYRTCVTGSASGTDVATSVVAGSIQATFPHTVETDWALSILSPTVPWDCEVPSVDPEGGPFELTLKCEGTVDAGSGLVTVTLLNGLAAY